jgi:hypothetical protein
VDRRTESTVRVGYSSRKRLVAGDGVPAGAINPCPSTVSNAVSADFSWPVFGFAA